MSEGNFFPTKLFLRRFNPRAVTTLLAVAATFPFSLFIYSSRLEQSWQTEKCTFAADVRNQLLEKTGDGRVRPTGNPMLDREFQCAQDQIFAERLKLFNVQVLSNVQKGISFSARITNT